MNLMTILEIASCYPEEILITASQASNGKWLSQMYRLKNGEIHKIMLSYDIQEGFEGFESEEEAKEKMTAVALSAIKYAEENFDLKKEE